MVKPKEKVDVRIDRKSATKVDYGIRTTVDAQPVLEESDRYRRFEREHGFKRGSEMRRVASLPMTVVMDIKTKHGIDVMNLRGTDGKRVMAIIDREYPLLKTTEMKFSKRGVD